MSLIQDKFGNEFLRSNGGMEPGFGPGMLMFSHLPPVTSFTRLASQTVMADLQPHEMILKKERDSPDCGGGGLSAGGMGCGGGIGGMMGSMGDYVHAMGIKQEKVSEHDYRLPLYPGGGVGTGVRSGEELLEVSLGNHQNLVAHDLSLGNVSVPMLSVKNIWTGWLVITPRNFLLVLLLKGTEPSIYILLNFPTFNITTFWKLNVL